MKRSVYIVGCGALSAMAANVRESHAAHAQGLCATLPRRIGGHTRQVGALCAQAERDLATLKEQNPRHESADRTVCLGVLAARQAIVAAELSRRESPVGVIVASSRGATESIEQRHAEFMETGRTRTLTSPTTISIGQDPSARWVRAHQSYARSAASTCPPTSIAIAPSTWFQTSVFSPGVQGTAPLGSCIAAIERAVSATCSAVRIPSTAGISQVTPPLITRAS